jgi:spermidine synthase
MLESLVDYDTFIHDEMMVHPVLFTHSRAKKIALIQRDNEDSGILNETLKHSTLKEIWQIYQNTTPSAKLNDPRIHYFMEDHHTWLETAPAETFDILILSDNTTHPLSAAIYKKYLNLMTNDGIFIRQSDSQFQLEGLKKTCSVMQEAGFLDLQIMHFPQPNSPPGLRAAIMGVKNAMFKRIREKDIFNKSFITRYYNYDVHKAALVMPEFMRKELEANF